MRAVELDAAALRRLEARFGGDPRVEVVAGDAAELPLPMEPIAVVAKLPFAAGTVDPAAAPRRSRRSPVAARRDRGVGARREAHGGLALDIAGLQLGCLV